MTETAYLELKNITYAYSQDHQVLQDVNLKIKNGTSLILVGSNGAGKSTLFSLLNGLLKPQAGQILYQGKPYEYSKSFITSLRQAVGMVFQNPDEQLFAGTVLDDVLFGPMNLGLGKSEALRKATEALNLVEISHLAERPVHHLSQGQKKRAALAGVLAMEPSVMLLDEPTAGLDAQGIADLTKLLIQLNRQGKTMIVATHDTDWAWEWGSEAAVLWQGKIVLEGPIQDVLSHEQSKVWGYHKPLAACLREALLKRDGQTQGFCFKDLLQQVVRIDE